MLYTVIGGDVLAKINKSLLTKMEIIRVACDRFLEYGYSNTTASSICRELEMSTGNLTFHYPTKEHLLAVLIDMLCSFQWKMMEHEADEGYSSVMAICLELMSMAAVCEEDEIAKDIYISAYQSPMSLEKIRLNDRHRAKQVFAQYCPDWTEEQYTEAETLVSGIEYATLMTTSDSAALDIRIAGALEHIMRIYNVPEELRKMKIKRVLDMDYRGIGRRVLAEFKEFVRQTNYNALEQLMGIHAR